MSYINGSINGEIYVGSVKWKLADEDKMLFSNKTERNNFLKNNLTKLNGNIIYSDPHGYIDVNLKIKNIQKANYCFFKPDDDFSDDYFCCYITNYTMIAPRTTRLFLHLDVFQQYIYDTTFYPSLVERAHVKKSDDIKYKWLESEPVGGTPTRYKNVGSDNLDWSVYWMLHTTSLLVNNEYKYGGSESTNNISGKYVYRISNNADLQSRLKGYTKSIEDAVQIDPLKLVANWFSQGTSIAGTGVNINAERFFDHSNEVMGLFARPAWSMIISGTGLQPPTNRAPYFDINLPTDLNGYTPTNNKLFSSLCNGYLIYNQAGVSIKLYPEKCTATYLRIQLFANAHDTVNYKLLVSRYSDPEPTFHTISYSCQTPVVSVSNTGVDALFSGLNAIAQSVPSIATSYITGGASGAIASAVSKPLQGLTLSQQKTISQNQQTLSNINDFNTGMQFAGVMPNLVESMQPQVRKIGSGNNFLDITPDFQKLSLYQVTPSIEEMKAIDDFLSSYGYAINEVLNINTYLNTRNNFNYLKTKDIKMLVGCPQNDYNEFKSVFDNGCRIWHNYEVFKQLEVPNN